MIELNIISNRRKGKTFILTRRDNFSHIIKPLEKGAWKNPK